MQVDYSKYKARKTSRAPSAKRARTDQSVPMQLVPAPVTRMGFSSKSISRSGAHSPEVKCFDFADNNRTSVLVAAVAGLDASLATGMTCLNDVQAGSSYNERIGSKITTKSLRVTFDTYAAVSAAGDSGMLRYMIVYDRQTNAAFPNITNLIMDSNGNVTFNAGINMTNRNRFLMLRDKVIDVDLQNNYVNHVDEYIRFVQDVDFAASAATIGDIKTGAIYFVCFYWNTTAAHSPVIYNFNSRLRYYD